MIYGISLFFHVENMNGKEAFKYVYHYINSE